MGFETQEEAERFAEAMEFSADQANEERMLKGAADSCCGETPCQWGEHPCERKKIPSSQQTLSTLADLLKANAVAPVDALKAAYTLGQFDGKMEMARVGMKKLP